MADIFRGETLHFKVYYDGDLLDRGPGLADAVLGACEADFSTLQGFFGGITPGGLPMTVRIVAHFPGANHGGCAGTTFNVGADATGGGNINYLVVAEEVEVFEAAIGRGWDCSASNGEGLSRVLASVLYRETSGYVTGPAWLDSDRSDYVNTTDPHDNNPLSTGCAVLFLNWLRYQEGFSWNQIILAGASTLVQTYTNLTGEADGWTRFTALLQRHFPEGRPSGLRTDNPFPLADREDPPPPLYHQPYHLGVVVLAGKAGGTVIYLDPVTGQIHIGVGGPDTYHSGLVNKGIQLVKEGLNTIQDALESQQLGASTKGQTLEQAETNNLSSPKQVVAPAEQTSTLAEPSSAPAQPGLQSKEELEATLIMRAPSIGLKAQLQLPSGRSIPITTEQVMVGRGVSDTPESAAIDLSSEQEKATISRIHAQITRVDDHFELEDRNSSNQTRLNQEILAPRQRYRLSNGDVIEFGKVRCVFGLA